MSEGREEEKLNRNKSRQSKCNKEEYKQLILQKKLLQQKHQEKQLELLHQRRQWAHGDINRVNYKYTNKLGDNDGAKKQQNAEEVDKKRKMILEHEITRSKHLKHDDQLQKLFHQQFSSPKHHPYSPFAFPPHQNPSFVFDFSNISSTSALISNQIACKPTFPTLTDRSSVSFFNTNNSIFSHIPSFPHSLFNPIIQNQSFPSKHKNEYTQRNSPFSNLKETKTSRDTVLENDGNSHEIVDNIKVDDGCERFVKEDND